MQEFIPRYVRAETGDTWRPRYGSHTSQTRHLADRVARLRYRTTRDRLGNPEFEIWSFAHITDLRTQAERDDGM